MKCNPDERNVKQIHPDDLESYVLTDAAFIDGDLLELPSSLNSVTADSFTTCDLDVVGKNLPDNVPPEILTLYPGPPVNVPETITLYPSPTNNVREMLTLNSDPTDIVAEHLSVGEHGHSGTNPGEQIKEISGKTSSTKSNTELIDVASPVTNKLSKVINNPIVIVDAETINNNELKTMCVFCQKIIEKGNIVNHMKNVHKTTTKTQEKIRQLGTETNLFNCDLCDFKTNKLYNLERHKRFSKSCIPSLICDVCDNSFSDITLFKIHKRSNC